MKAAEWIDRVKIKCGWESDYRVAKELHLSRNTISTYRGGRSQTMDEDTAAKVAFALGENPAAIIIDQVAERSKDPAIRAALLNVSNSLCILCKQAIASVLEAACAHVVRAAS